MPAFFIQKGTDMRNLHTITSNQKIHLRKCYIQGAQNYNHFLMGKIFLIICEDGTETTIRFFKKDYIHLTGIETNLGDNIFFENCKNSTLNNNNILTHQKYNWSTLRGKGTRIQNIHRIIYSNVKESLFIFNLHTNTAHFPVAIRNCTINTCIGFKDELHKARTLRKFTNSGSSDCEKKIVAIFAKKESQSMYDELVYISSIHKIYEMNNTFLDKLSNLLRNRLECIIETEKNTTPHNV